MYPRNLQDPGMISSGEPSPKFHCQDAMVPLPAVLESDVNRITLSQGVERTVKEGTGNACTVTWWYILSVQLSESVVFDSTA